MLKQQTAQTQDPEAGVAFKPTAIEIPDVSEQLARIEEATEAAAAEKESDVQKRRRKRYECCGIRTPL